LAIQLHEQNHRRGGKNVNALAAIRLDAVSGFYGLAMLLG